MTRAFGPAAIVAAAVAVPLLYVPGAESPFADPKLALLLIAGGVGLAAALLAWARGEPPRGRASLRVAGAAVLLTTALAAAIAAARQPFGAPYAAGEIVRLLAIAGIAAAAAQAVRDARWRRRLFDGVHVAAGVVSLIGLLQHLELLPFTMPIISVPGSTFGNRNMAAEAVALSLPFSLAVLASRRWPWRRAPDGAGGEARGMWTWLAAGLLLAELLYLAATRARGAWIGGALGIAAFLAIRRPALPRAARLLLIPLAGAVAVAALLPGAWRSRDANDTKRFEVGTRVVLDAIDPASPVARTRLGLWRRTLAIYRDHPLAGGGPGNFSALFPLHAEPGAAADGVMSATMIPRRPHNELLERLAETGPLGAAALVGLFVAAFAAARAAGRASRGAGGAAGDIVADVDAASAGAGGVAACLGCGLTAFPLAMPATALLFGVSLGAIDALAPAAAGAADGAGERPARRRGAAFVAAALAAILVAGAGWLSFGVFASAHWRGRAKAALAGGAARKPDTAAALAALERAAAATRLDGVRFDIALRTAQVAVDAGKGWAAYQAATRALALEPYSPHALGTRAAAQLGGGLLDLRGATADAEQALRRFPELPVARAAHARATAMLGPYGRLDAPAPAPVDAGRP
jgi:O-antigen ligase